MWTSKIAKRNLMSLFKKTMHNPKRKMLNVHIYYGNHHYPLVERYTCISFQILCKKKSRFQHWFFCFLVPKKKWILHLKKMFVQQTYTQGSRIWHKIKYCLSIFSPNFKRMRPIVRNRLFKNAYSLYCSIRMLCIVLASDCWPVNYSLVAKEK